MILNHVLFLQYVAHLVTNFNKISLARKGEACFIGAPTRIMYEPNISH